jgi:response regulator of citrate/malate metabolism
MSVKEVAEEAGISWITARKYLNELVRKGIVGRK